MKRASNRQLSQLPKNCEDVMWKDPIVEEVRRVREEYAEAFNFDIDSIINDLQQQEIVGERIIVQVKTENDIKPA